MNGNKKTPVKGDDIKNLMSNSPQVSGGSGSVTRSSVLTGKVPSSNTKSGSTKKEVKAFMQDLPNKGKKYVVGGSVPVGGGIKPLLQAGVVAASLLTIGTAASHGHNANKNTPSFNLRGKFDQTRVGKYLNAHDEYTKTAPKASKTDGIKDGLMKVFRMGKYKGNPPKF